MSTEATISMLVTTLPDEAHAVRMARQLIEAGEAACAQIEPIRSFYRWKGAVVDEPEWRLTIKLRHDRVAAVMQSVRALHPYEVPEIVSLDIARGDPAYVRWVAGDDQ